MSTNIELPAWLDACRPDDALYADAYEGTAPELRALLKTAIAFAFHRWPSTGDESCSSRCSGRSGFAHEELRRPATWVLALLGPGFASPARLLAALIPAVIAGTKHILIVSEAPFSPAVCTALELAGLEDSFMLTAEQVPGLYEDLRALSPEGRMVAFPGSDGALTSAQQELLHAAALDGLPRHRDLPSPRILSLYGEDSETDARLRWLHPDAELLRTPAPGLHAVFTPDDSTTLSRYFPAFLCGPGMEACWPGPAPDFYTTSSCSAFLFQENSLEDHS